MLNVLTRSVPVMESLFTGLAEKRPGFRTPAVLLARLGQISLPLIRFTVPGASGRRSLQRLLNLAYIFEVFLILVSALLGIINGGIIGFTRAVLWFGIVSLLITLSVDLALRFIESLIGD